MLKGKIDKLGDSLYNLNARDPESRYENLKTYRAEMIHGFVVYMHLAIEDLWRALFFDFLVRLNRSLPSREAKGTVDNMKSAEITHWCRRLRLISEKQYNRLMAALARFCRRTSDSGH